MRDELNGVLIASYQSTKRRELDMGLRGREGEQTSSPFSPETTWRRIN
jgi:hypothetical protein